MLPRSTTLLNTLTKWGGRVGGRAVVRRGYGPVDHVGRHRPMMPMSGRFAQHFTWHEIRDRYDLVGGARTIEPRYNIAPATTIEVVVVPWAVGTTIIQMRWGLIPAWWTKAVKDLPPTFNVHARRVTEPFFWSAFKRNRCIIPASGYFEWKTMPDGRQPYYISAADGGVLSIAGVWDVWINTETGDTVSSCCMIITSANAFTRAVHNRMPALLDKKDFEPWLSGAAGTEVLKPAEEDYLRMWPVSRRVDQTDAGDDSALIADVATAGRLSF
jgi:putative SOS response-associated peptidase YedK